MTSTGDGDISPEGLPAESLEAAESELARVREVLESAARGDASGAELAEALQGYMEEHGPALRAAASAIGEEARRQTLEQLYAWRAQLAAQLEARKQQP
jgi:hypothetical protein